MYDGLFVKRIPCRICAPFAALELELVYELFSPVRTYDFYASPLWSLLLPLVLLLCFRMFKRCSVVAYPNLISLIGSHWSGCVWLLKKQERRCRAMSRDWFVGLNSKLPARPAAPPSLFLDEWHQQSQIREICSRSLLARPAHSECQPAAHAFDWQRKVFGSADQFVEMNRPFFCRHSKSPEEPNFLPVISSSTPPSSSPCSSQRCVSSCSCQSPFYAEHDTSTSSGFHGH